MGTKTCPHCGEETLTIKDRLKATKWQIVTCPNCGGRSCMQPVVLSLLWVGYLWNFMLFGYLAWYEQSVVYVVVTILGWLTLEYFGYYIPLVRMKRRARAADQSEDG